MSFYLRSCPPSWRAARRWFLIDSCSFNTYFGPNKRQVCLDYILVPTRWIRSIRSSAVILRTRLVASDHKAVVTNFKLRIRRPRRHPPPFPLFDWPQLSEDVTRERFEQAVSARLADVDLNADSEPDPSGFSRLKNALHSAATEVIPRQPVPPVTPIRDLPAIQAGRSLAAILNVSPSQIMPALYQEELSRRLATICKEIEECFEGNRSGKTYKKIADIAGTSQRHHPGLSRHSFGSQAGMGAPFHPPI